MYTADNVKCLTKEMLLQVLSGVPDGALLACNKVGNISVLNPVTEDPVGYIDFLFEEEYEQYE